MQITVEGAERIQARLMNTASRWTKDTSEILNKAAGVLYASVALNFQQGGRPQPWARRVSNADGQFIRPDKKTHPILIKTGRLMRAATGKGESLKREEHTEGKHSIEIGPDTGAIPYAWAQQAGYRPRNLCARPYLMMQEEDREKIIELFRAWYFKDFENS